MTHVLSVIVTLNISLFYNSTSLLFYRLLEIEEANYKYTNVFTTADENSPLGISKCYRHLQHNMRASAVRASKGVYAIPPKKHFCDQTMVNV